jgi:hypothetical protein
LKLNVNALLPYKKCVRACVLRNEDQLQHMFKSGICLFVMLLGGMLTVAVPVLTTAMYLTGVTRDLFS